MNLASWPVFFVSILLVFLATAISKADDAPLPQPSRLEAYYPGPTPGLAESTVRENQITLGTSAISVTWTIAATGIRRQNVNDRQGQKKLELHGEDFIVLAADGAAYPASSLAPEGKPRASDLAADPQSVQLAGRLPGKKVELPFHTADSRFRIIWRGLVRDGGNYVREEIEITPLIEAAKIKEIVWLKESLPAASAAGTVDGVPILAENIFLGSENPHAQVSCGIDAVCRLPCPLEIGIGKAYSASFVCGVTPPDQLRRGFQYYVECERAHPYRPFLHYNSWYDISWQGAKMDEANCTEAIRIFGEQFIRPYSVQMDSFVFDDGWDDPQTLWEFHAGFSQGFAPHAELARSYGSHLGVWLSPKGGYGRSGGQRLKFGREQGYEINASGFSLSGPKYYEAFKTACLQMIRRYGVNHFKFDGIARGSNNQGAGDEFLKDTEALRHLMLELRREDPQLYINFTAGSWPSPFWLRFADSLWRQGHDMGVAGKGDRQQLWLTYRDREVYRNIVRRSPLYPLNALMTQGVAYSKQGMPGEPEFTSAGFKDDVRAFFGGGTSLQELYIRPQKLTADDWRVLAEAAQWSRTNAGVLYDTHWIGGDPANLEVYGYASWTPQKGILMLRNPSDQPQDFLLDVATAFELPPETLQKYTLNSPWMEDAAKPSLSATAGQPLKIHLRPFEVLNCDALPE